MKKLEGNPELTQLIVAILKELESEEKELETKLFIVRSRIQKIRQLTKLNNSPNKHSIPLGTSHFAKSLELGIPQSSKFLQTKKNE